MPPLVTQRRHLQASLAGWVGDARRGLFSKVTLQVHPADTTNFKIPPEEPVRSLVPGPVIILLQQFRVQSSGNLLNSLMPPSDLLYRAY
jgi:hypothetical protein